MKWINTAFLLLSVFFVISVGYSLNRNEYIDQRYYWETINESYVKTITGEEAFLGMIYSIYNGRYVDVIGNFTGNLSLTNALPRFISTFCGTNRPASYSLFAESDLNITGVSFPLISRVFKFQGDNYYLEIPKLSRINLFVNKSENWTYTAYNITCDNINASKNVKPMEECIIDFFANGNLSLINPVPAGSFIKLEFAPNRCMDEFPNCAYGTIPIWELMLGDLYSGSFAVHSNWTGIQGGSAPNIWPISQNKSKLGMSGCNADMVLSGICTWLSEFWPNETNFNSTFQLYSFAYPGFGRYDVWPETPYYVKNLFNWYGTNLTSKSYYHRPDFSFSTYIGSYGLNITNYTLAVCSSNIGGIPIPPIPPITGECDEWLDKIALSTDNFEIIGYNLNYFLCNPGSKMLYIMVYSVIAIGIIFIFYFGFTLIIQIRKRI